MRHGTCSDGRFTIGLDLGDRSARYAVLSETTLVEQAEVLQTRRALKRLLRRWPGSVVVMEAGTHSPWVSRLVEELGHPSLVANPRRLPLIYRSRQKSDSRDAQRLARLARMDVALLSPIEHRGEQAQLQLMLVRSRDALVRNRTQLINHIRGTVKSFGARLPSGISATAFGHKATDHLPEALRPVLEEMVVLVARITEQIQRFEEEIERWVEAHPEAKVLMAVPGVGPLTAMAFVLTLEDPHRFRRSREAGAYLGLVPRRHGSGKRDPELGITKTGDTHVRRLLVQCAHHMMRKKGQDTDLRRWGLKLAARGQKNAKKRAVVAVARKLAVLLHRLWVTGAEYDPLRQARRQAA
jgi:transposase